ncbi:MAG: enoyl-CoA hydratase [Gemmataceae bacterium]|nr:enoyl-CoA hydratase [Gemmataceae bacterium]
MGELLLEKRDGLARLTLDRPAKRNALSLSLLQGLEETLRGIAADRSVRVVVLGGSGPVFSSGHDLGEMVGRTEEDYRALFSCCSRVMLSLRRLPQPVIARVHGHAFAAGCQLVAACDLAVAAEEATFATPGVKIGLFCTTPLVPLVRAVPAKAAMEMLLTGGAVPAKQALAWGLVNRVVPATQLDDAVMELARPILAASPMTVAMGKEAFYRQQSLSEEDAYAVATDVMTANALKHDAQEGMGAFLGKRPPRWEGR